MTPKQKGINLTRYILLAAAGGLLLLISPVLTRAVQCPASFVDNRNGGDCTPSTNVIADPQQLADLNAQIAENQKRLDDLKAQEEQYQQQVDAAQSEVKSYQSQLNVLSNAIALSNIDIQKSQVQIDALNLEMQTMQLAIDQKGAEIATNRKMLIDAIQQLDSNSRVSTLALVMQYNNFGEFFSQAQAQAQISQSLNDTISTISLAKADLENKQKELSDAKDQAKQEKALLETQKASVQVQADYQTELLNKSKHSAAEYQQVLNDKVNEEAEVNSTISGLQGHLQAVLSGDAIYQANEPSPSGYIWPVPLSARNSKVITCTYHCSNYPWGTHEGLDIGVQPMTQVYAVASAGRIMRCGQWSYGNDDTYPSDGVCRQPSDGRLSIIGIQYGGGIMVEYMHLIQFAQNSTTKTAFHIGDVVYAGQLIGYSGGREGAIGSGTQTLGSGHLHIQFNVNADLAKHITGNSVNPLNFLPY